MNATTDETIGQIVARLSVAESTTENDERTMTLVLRRCGWPRAFVACGIVYLEGRGTMHAQPCDIPTMARLLLAAATQ